MKTRLLASALFALTLTAGTLAGQETANTQVGSESLLTLSATVTAVNQETREVTLTDAEGNSHTINVSDQVKNLPQVEVGDQLDIAYYERVTFEVLSPEEATPEVAAGAAMGTSEAGEKPGAAGISEVAFVAKVEAIDKDAETVDLKGPAGNIRTVVVANPENLNEVAVGDQLLITVTEAVAMAVSESPSED